MKTQTKYKQITTLKEDLKRDNIRVIKECADMLTLEETETLITYLKRKFKIEIH